MRHLRAHAGPCFGIRGGEPGARNFPSDPATRCGTSYRIASRRILPQGGGTTSAVRRSFVIATSHARGARGGSSCPACPRPASGGILEGGRFSSAVVRAQGTRQNQVLDHGSQRRAGVMNRAEPGWTTPENGAGDRTSQAHLRSAALATQRVATPARRSKSRQKWRGTETGGGSGPVTCDPPHLALAIRYEVPQLVPSESCAAQQVTNQRPANPSAVPCPSDAVPAPPLECRCYVVGSIICVVAQLMIYSAPT